MTYTVSGGASPYTVTVVNSSGTATLATGSTSSNTGTLTGLPPVSFSIHVVDVNGCNGGTTGQVSVSPTVTNIGFSTTSVSCNGANNGIAFASAPSSFTANPISYTWQPGAYNTASIGGMTGGVVYTVTVRDNQGCTATNTVSVNEPPPIISTLTNTYITCFGYTLSSPIVSTGTVGATSYTVNNAAVSSSIATNLMAGTQTIITRDSKGCTATNTVLVTQGLQSLINFSITKPTCPGTSDGTVVPNISNAPPAYNYTWLPGGSNGSNGSSLQNVPTGTYTLTLQDGNSCITQSLVNVLPAQSAIVTALTKPENCSAADGSFTLNVTGAGPPFTFTTLPIGPHSNSVVSNLSTGSYTAITNYNGSCIDSLVFNVGNLSTVSVSVINSVPVKCFNSCTGSVLIGVQNAVSPVTYSLTGVPSSTSNLITNLCAGFYVIKVVDNNGCPATTTLNFATPTAFSYSATGPSAVCAGQPVMLTGSASGGSGGYSFVWQPGNIPGQVISTVPPGTTVYTLNAYDSNGCMGAAQHTVNVQPLISINIGSSGAGICPGTTTQITPTVTGGDGNYSYQWQPGGYTSPSVFVENVTVPIYTLVVTDGCGSPAAIRLIPVNLFPVTQPVFTATKNRGCEPLCTRFVNLTPKATAIKWNYGDRPLEQTGDTTQYCYQRAGLYNISISLTDSNNCKASYSYTNAIEVLASPKAGFVSDPARITIKAAEQVYLKNTTANGGTYRWFYGEAIGGKLLGETENIYYTFRDTGCYKFSLIANNLNGCSDTAQKFLCVEEGFNFYMPNCFTPNESGLNDVLIPQGTGWLKKNYLFEVFNRWGLRIFSTTDVNTGWNGANTDNQTPYNSYIWRITVTDTDDVPHSFSGPVTVLR